MKIWFGCSTADFLKYQEHYLAIRDFLVKEGHILTRDWLKPTLSALEHRKAIKGPEKLYNEVMQAVNQAELLVIEDTVSNFSTGHQITIALQRKKPVLVLWLESETKNKYFKETFLQGYRSPYLQISQYNKDNYEEIIRAFIKKYSHATDRHRFHLVIDEVERQYLEWAKFAYGQSRTDIIRSALRQRADSDSQYLKYLSNI